VKDQRDLAYAVELVGLDPIEIQEPATPKIREPATMMRDRSNGGFAAVRRIVPITIQMRVLNDTLKNGFRMAANTRRNLEAITTNPAQCIITVCERSHHRNPPLFEGIDVGESLTSCQVLLSFGSTLAWTNTTITTSL
jgi:hypothetical protein